MTRSLAQLLVGRTLADRYLVEEVIGRGGMSIVYRARDERLGRQVALKVVSLPEEASRADARERFRREAAAAASIPPHPNVVHVYDYGTDAALDIDFIAMELLRGHDLRTALEGPPRALPATLRILREAARGVAAGHRAGLVHRDVKPGNIVLVGDPAAETAKILDFGIAKAFEVGDEEDLTRTGQLPHSPAYASPEQVRPGGRVGPASDVYQLGLVAYELLAGERPFTVEERERIRAGEAVPVAARGRWESVPPAIREVVEQALRPDPSGRPADAAEFAEALAGAEASAAEDRTIRLVSDDDGTVLLTPSDGVPARPAPGAPIPRAGAPSPVDPPAADADETVLTAGEPAAGPGPPGSVSRESARRRSANAESPPPASMSPVAVQTGHGPTSAPVEHGHGPTAGPGEDDHAPSATPGARDGRGGAGLRRRPLWLAGGAAALLLLIVWGVTRGGEDPAPVAATDLDLPALEDEFHPLYADAADRLAESGPATDTSAAAAAEVMRVIEDLNVAWVHGELDRHASHYADRVDFYGDRVSRSRIRSLREEAHETYPEAEITLERQAVTFPEPDEARALVDKRWRFSGPGARWEGEARQELRLRREGGRWRVVSEEDVEVFRSEKEG